MRRPARQKHARSQQLADFQAAQQMHEAIGGAREAGLRQGEDRDEGERGCGDQPRIETPAWPRCRDILPARDAARRAGVFGINLRGGAQGPAPQAFGCAG